MSIYNKGPYMRSVCHDNKYIKSIIGYLYTITTTRVVYIMHKLVSDLPG